MHPKAEYVELSVRTTGKVTADFSASLSTVGLVNQPEIQSWEGLHTADTCGVNHVVTESIN